MKKEIFTLFHNLDIVSRKNSIFSKKKSRLKIISTIFLYQDQRVCTLHSRIVTVFDGRPELEPTDSTAFTTSFP